MKPECRPIVLISNDGGFSRDKISLHPELQQELNDRGIEISYYSSLEGFLIAQNRQIPEEDLLIGVEVRIIGGSLRVQGINGGPQFNLLATDFEVSNDHADPGRVEAAQMCFPCRPNSKIGLGSSFVGSLGLGAGPATIRKKEYQHLYYAGQIDFSGAADVGDSSAPRVFVSGEFTFNGWMNGYEANPFVGNPGKAVFEVRMKGRGASTVELASYVNEHYGRLYDFRSITYDFQP